MALLMTVACFVIACISICAWRASARSNRESMHSRESCNIALIWPFVAWLQFGAMPMTLLAADSGTQGQPSGPSTQLAHRLQVCGTPAMPHLQQCRAPAVAPLPTLLCLHRHLQGAMANMPKALKSLAQHKAADPVRLLKSDAPTLLRSVKCTLPCLAYHCPPSPPCPLRPLSAAVC